MKYSLSTCFLILALVSITSAQNCVPTNINGKIFYSCNQSCTNIQLQVPNLRSTGDYKVSSISYQPYAYTTPSGTIDDNIYNDDWYSAVFDLPFPFCLFDSTYTQATIGSNGLMTFDIANAACFCAYNILRPMPAPIGGGPCVGNFNHPRASVMGCYTDWDPRPGPLFVNQCSPPERKIEWRVEGTAPCRKFIVSFYHLGVFYNHTMSPCSATNPSSFQMVMYESTGLIDVFIESKICDNFSGNKAILGIQNWARDKAVTAPGKNATIWTATNEGYRFTPSGNTSRFVNCQLYSIADVLIANADTSTNIIDSSLLNLNFSNICSVNDTTQYIVKTNFAACPTGILLTSVDTITIIKSTLCTYNATVSGCGGHATVTLNPQPLNVYAMDNGPFQSSNVFTNVPGGFHTFYFQLVMGGTLFPVVVVVPVSLSATFTITPISCRGANDGTVITHAKGGYPPYKFYIDGNISNLQTDSAFGNLTPGNHVISLIDNANCTGSANVIITEPTPITVSATLQNVTCFGSANGSITLNALGGTGSHQYSKDAGSNFQTSNTFTLLNPGIYFIQVKDSNNCVKDTSFTITEPTALTATAITDSATCNGNDGIITISASGGTPNYEYSINNGLNYQSSNSFIDTIGSYPNIKVKDANGCTANTSASIYLNDTMRLSFASSPLLVCQGNPVTLFPVTNNATNIFTWLPNDNTLSNTAIKNPVAKPTDTTIYLLTAQWGKCTRSSSIQVNVLTKPLVHVGEDSIVCFNTAAFLYGTVTHTSGSVNYLWSPLDSLVTPTNITTVTNWRSTRTYTLMVTDNYSCNFSVSDDITITVLPPLQASAGNDTTVMTGETFQLNSENADGYIWTSLPLATITGSHLQTPTAIIFTDTKFMLQVNNIGGCPAFDTVFVRVINGPDYYIPNAFSPNADNLNDVFRVNPIGIKQTQYFRIFNRLGQMVFETTDLSRGWDGIYKGKMQDPGTYIWMIKGIDKNDNLVQKKGTVVLVK